MWVSSLKQHHGFALRPERVPKNEILWLSGRVHKDEILAVLKSTKKSNYLAVPKKPHRNPLKIPLRWASTQVLVVVYPNQTTL